MASHIEIDDAVESGAAISRMQLLAQKIYETTPGIAKCKLMHGPFSFSYRFRVPKEPIEDLDQRQGNRGKRPS